MIIRQRAFLQMTVIPCCHKLQFFQDYWNLNKIQSTMMFNCETNSNSNLKQKQKLDKQETLRNEKVQRLQLNKLQIKKMPLTKYFQYHQNCLKVNHQSILKLLSLQRLKLNCALKILQRRKGQKSINTLTKFYTNSQKSSDT